VKTIREGILLAYFPDDLVTAIRLRQVGVQKPLWIHFACAISIGASQLSLYRRFLFVVPAVGIGAVTSDVNKRLHSHPPGRWPPSIPCDF